MARFSSIRALLAFAVQNDMLVHQMDVVTAFLNGNLEEEVYMEQPPGSVWKGEPRLQAQEVTVHTVESGC